MQLMFISESRKMQNVTVHLNRGFWAVFVNEEKNIHL